MKDIDFDELDRAITSVLEKNNQQMASPSTQKAAEPAVSAVKSMPTTPPNPSPVSTSNPVAAPPQPAVAPVLAPAATKTAAPTVARVDRMASSSLHARTMVAHRQRGVRPLQSSSEASTEDNPVASSVAASTELVHDAPAIEALPATPQDNIHDPSAVTSASEALDGESLSRRAAEAFPLGVTYAAKYDATKRRHEAIETAVEDLVASLAVDDAVTTSNETKDDLVSPIMHNTYANTSSLIDTESDQAVAEQAPHDISVKPPTQEAVLHETTNEATHEVEPEREDEQVRGEVEADMGMAVAAPPRRVHGRFMDVIHPSSDMRHLTGASRIVQPSRGVDQSTATDRSAQTNTDKAMEQEVRAVLGRGVVIEPPQVEEAAVSVQDVMQADTVAAQSVDMAAVMKEELDSLKNDTNIEAAIIDTPAVEPPVAEEMPTGQPATEEAPSHDVADRLVAEIEAIEKGVETDVAPVTSEVPSITPSPELQPQAQVKDPAARPIAVPKVASMAQRQAAAQGQPTTEEYPVFDAESHRLPVDTTKKKTVLWAILTILIFIALLGALGVIGWVLFTA